MKELRTDLYADDGLIFFYEDSGGVTFSCNEMGTLSVNLNNINFYNNFDKDDPNTIIVSDFWLDRVNFKKEKHLKKISEELITTAWHPKRWWNFCIPDIDKKEKSTFYWAMLLL